MTPLKEQHEFMSGNENDSNKYTLYFIRHGEALHNVLEKKAKQDAKRHALAEGLSEDSVKLRMEQARMAILNNNELQDCPLTPRGKEEAAQARQRMQELISGGLPPPEEVLVSPLQRALQTADAVFPDFHTIHVREELQERQTLKACDTRQASRILASRPEFSRFSMKRLRLASLNKEDMPSLEQLFCEPSSTAPSIADIAEEGPTSQQEELTTLKHNQVEEKHMLRERTKKLFTLIKESEHNVIAIVAHKGYMRELERGPLGQEDATEFQNCEVRVYNLELLPNSTKLKSAERIV